MIQQIRIQNYKSLADLTLELGRINVLIGENGSGKTNVLEAVALGCAALRNTLGNPYMSSIGIRLTDSNAMKSGFDKECAGKNIEITFDEYLELVLYAPKDRFSSWTADNTLKTVSNNFIQQILDGKEKINMLGEEFNLKEAGADEFFLYLLKFSQMRKEKDGVDDFVKQTQKDLSLKIEKDLLENISTDFKIFAPENYFLRRFEDENLNGALGVRGEGLFGLLSQIAFEDKNKPDAEKKLPKIQESLEILGWYDGFDIPNDLMFTEKRLQIKDRYLEDGLQFFDQKSANEGFLLLLFYFTLFISEYTPKFFAIDNIDNGMNPKMCMELMRILTRLAKEHGKQVIFTTHNPAVLDGLNLNDDEVRLLVASRNKIGHTKVLRVERKPTPEGIRPMRLSEMFINGMLGGLPKNF
ncbi:MAG: hypothetical protein RLZZ292_796 [Bacteroidota bacterium]|jgi:AAA15 family ATPase/GTPase